jgi:hypothetical protein
MKKERLLAGGLPGLNTYSKVEINYHLKRVAVLGSFRVPQ